MTGHYLKHAVVLAFFLGGLAMCSAGAWSQEPSSLKWTVKVLAVDSNEGIDLADFNGDGKLDVVAGRNWYAAPEFVPRPVRTIEDWSGYVESNGDYAYDVDGDGLTDVISGSFLPTEVYWFKNPGPELLNQGKMWERRLLVDTQASTNEGQLLHDLDGDGVPEWIVNAWRNDVPMLVWKFGREQREVTVQEGRQQKTVQQEVPTLNKIVIGESGNGHGMAIGDINNDGHDDILVGQGWYEAPPSDPLTGGWKFHPDWQLHSSIPMIVRDMDRDGRNDLLLGEGHNFGLYWWQQQAPGEDGKLAFKQHVIDDQWSQPHCLHMADLDGDGQDELITGKRVFAHNGRDPGGQDPPCLFYYKWHADKKEFSRHTIDRGSVGGGLQIRTGDLNGDGRLDIAVAGKSGTYILFNEGP